MLSSIINPVNIKIMYFLLMIFTLAFFSVACLENANDISKLIKLAEFYDHENKANIGKRLKFATFCFSAQLSMVVMTFVFFCVVPWSLSDKIRFVGEYFLAYTIFLTLGTISLHFLNPVKQLHLKNGENNKIELRRRYKKTINIIKENAFPLLVTFTLFPYLFGFILLHLIIKDADERTFFEAVIGERFYKTDSLVSPKWIDTHL